MLALCIMVGILCLSCAVYCGVMGCKCLSDGEPVFAMFCALLAILNVSLAACILAWGITAGA